MELSIRPFCKTLVTGAILSDFRWAMGGGSWLEEKFQDYLA